MEIKTFIVDMLKWRLAQYLELRWWKKYLRGKNKAAYLAWKRRYWEEVLLKIGGVPSAGIGKHICDVGCGPAGIFIALPEHRVRAIDPLIDKYENEISFFNKGEYPHTVFECSPLEEYVTQQTFDVVFCMNCINHVRDINKGVAKLHELCAGGGVLVLSVDAHRYSFFKHLFRLVPGDVLHPQQYGLEEYQQFLSSSGFSIIKTVLLKQEDVFEHWVIVAK